MDYEHYITLTLEAIFQNLTEKSFVTTNYKHGPKKIANHVAAELHFPGQHGPKNSPAVLPMIKKRLLDDFSQNLVSFS